MPACFAFLTCITTAVVSIASSSFSYARLFFFPDTTKNALSDLRPRAAYRTRLAARRSSTVSACLVNTKSDVARASDHQVGAERNSTGPKCSELPSWLCHC